MFVIFQRRDERNIIFPNIRDPFIIAGISSPGIALPTGNNARFYFNPDGPLCADNTFLNIRVFFLCVFTSHRS